MKKRTSLVMLMLMLSFCGDTRPQRVATCQPSITSSRSPARPNTTVRVFWDVSMTMRMFVGGRGQPKALDAMVETLDSAILVAAGAREVRHYAVGDTIVEARNATRALRPDAGWTALHDAAEKAGIELASKRAGAVIFVSDMKLEIPAEQIAGGGTACGGSIPSTPRAGALFGRCLNVGLSRGPVIGDFFAQALRSCSASDCIYVLLIAADAELGRRIAIQMQTTWSSRVTQLKSYLIVDSPRSHADLTTAPQCTWTERGSSGLRLSETARPQECRVRCDGKDPVRVHCSLPTTRAPSWLVPRVAEATTIPAAKPFTATVNIKQDGFDLSMRCPRAAKWTTTGSRITYEWTAAVPAEISADADTRRLFESVAGAIQERAARPETTLTMTIR